MKTKLISSLKSIVLLVDGLPENSCNIKDTLANGVYYQLPDGIFDSWHIPEEIKGNWNLLGKLKDLTDKDCEGLVKQSIHTNLFAHYVKGIEVNTYCYKSAKESFLSALEAEGVLFENPYKQQFDKYFHIKHFEKAEQNVFSPETIIFVEQ